jgi:methionine-rich copper-binding protein CopC
VRGALALALACLDAASAHAHARLLSASPPAGAAVAPPAEIRLSFSQRVEPQFCNVSLSGPGGAVPLGWPSAAPGDSKVLIVKIGAKLAPGAYTVNWRAVSVDAHRTQGDFDFTVK